MKGLTAILTLNLMMCLLSSFAQPNCNLFEDNANCQEACLETERAVKEYSGSESFQKHLLNAIELSPDFHHAYFELSVNYAKRGLLNEWIQLINKAVEISPQDHLGWRGWYHWFFANNYEKAIEDIDRLDSLISYDLGTTGDGLYHLNILKALCYKGLGETKKSIDIFENYMNSEEYYQGSYDYLHLAVLYLSDNQPLKALEALEAQNSYNELSEVYFYSAQANLLLGNTQKAIELLQLSLSKYEKGLAMHDPYRELPDEIHKVDIEEALRTLASK